MTRRDGPPPDPHEPPSKAPSTDEGREGATEKQVGDRTGPGAGYDKEPEQEDDKGGVTPS
jgi:hypothetical protein